MSYGIEDSTHKRPASRRLAARIIARIALAGLFAALLLALAAPVNAATEAELKLPDLSQVQFMGYDGRTLLMTGILFCVFGLAFGLVIYMRLKNLPVHRAMREISELIYETCKT
ncbi:MAG: sodium-translocating pyrophosphatase, partial [Candidatus Acidiferrales bacterium]